MTNQKGLAPILIVILIAAGLGGYLIYQKQTRSTPAPQPTTQPSPSPAASPVQTDTGETANWKTYTNTEYHFLLKYPPNWKVLDITEEPVGTGIGAEGESLMTPLNSLLKDKFQEDVKLVITITSPADYKPVVPKKLGELWISGIRLEVKKGTKDKELIKGSAFDRKAERVKVNNLDIIKISRTNQRLERNTSTALFESNGLLFNLSNDTPGTGENNELFDQILSTFKFTN